MSQLTDGRADGRADDMAERIRPLLVPTQFVAMAALLWPGPSGRLPVRVRAAGAVAVVGGAALAGAAAARLGRELTPVVDPLPGARLQTGGVFAVSRHPVYTGLLVASAGWTALRGRRELLVATVVLSGVLHVKAILEERRLRARFGEDYAAYAARTPRLLGLRHR